MIEFMYVDRATVKRAKRSKSIRGTMQFTTQTIYEDVPCRLSQSGKNLLHITQGSDGVNTQISLKLYLSPKYEIKANDVIEVRGFKLYAGVPFSYPTHQEVNLSWEQV